MEKRILAVVSDESDVTPEDAEVIEAAAHRIEFRDELGLVCINCERQRLRKLCKVCFDRVLYGIGVDDEGHWWLYGLSCRRR